MTAAANTSLTERCRQVNPKQFILFRIFFNGRFYYPVFAIMFRDYGLGTADFAVLNLVWAISIVAFEVPSGALADQVGRKPLVVFAAILMILEMAVLLVVQPGSHFVFLAFLANRILSGLAEACASGADEALAFDSLTAEERSTRWPEILNLLMKWTAIVFIIASIVGGLVYDPALMTKVLNFFGLARDAALTTRTTVKFPIFLTFVMAIACLFSALRMIEAPIHVVRTGIWKSVKDSFAAVIDTGKWIFRTRVVWLLLLLGVLLDSMARLFLTVSSDYYRLIQIPEGYYGVIGAAGAVFGIVTASIMERRVKLRKVDSNFFELAVMIVVGLIGAAFAWPIWGVIFVVPFMLAMRFLQFYQSHYLNQVIDSKRRATALSFNGLSTSIAYGAMNIIYALQSKILTHAGDTSEMQSFARVIRWWPVLFIAMMIGYVVIHRAKTRRSLNELVHAHAG